jgi:hypothetical protein
MYLHSWIMSGDTHTASSSVCRLNDGIQRAGGVN